MITKTIRKTQEELTFKVQNGEWRSTNLHINFVLFTMYSNHRTEQNKIKYT